MRKPCKLKALKRYIFSSATGMQNVGSDLKMPCNRTFKFKTAKTNAARGGYGNGGASSSGRLEYIWLPLENDSAVPIGLYRSGKFLAVHSDHLNTPRLITDDANKAVWQWPYSAFGDNAPTGILKATAHPASAYTQDPMTNARLQATNPGIAYNLRFPGQYFDVETGLYQNYFRSYNAAQGRYTQNDPIGLNGGLNRYAYVGGSPLIFTDPMGLQAIPVQLPIPGVPNPSLDAQRALADRLSRSFRNDSDTTYQTYTRYNPSTGQCYSGRTSGDGSPEANVRNRGYGQPLLNAEGFNPHVLDRSSSNSSSIRGREQQLIELNGGARSSGGDSRNMINGIGFLNFRGPLFYLPAANAEFGTPVPAGQCTCQ